MIRTLLLSLCIFPSLVFAQNPNFEEDFNSQDLSTWAGTTSDFTFVTEGDNILLQQNAAAAGTSWLSIPSTNVEGYWEFFVQMGFSPSNSNMSEIFLMSDSEDLTGPLNGYMLQAGENLSTDVFRLFRITNGSKNGEILTGTTNISAAGSWRVRVTRNNAGEWTLEVGTGYLGTLVEEATGTDNTYTSATHFGVRTRYTVINTANFRFDFKVDFPPLTVTSVSAFSGTEIDAAFLHSVDFSTVQPTDFVLNPGNLIPQSVTQINSTTARLAFANSLGSGVNTLQVSGIDAIEESTLADTTVYFTIFDDYQPGDIVINEFLKDPPTGASEYVELWNTSPRYLNLKSWRIGDNNSLVTLSNNDLAMPPNSYLVVTPDSNSIKTLFNDADFVQVSLPALNNGTDQVRLFNNANQLLDSLEYNSTWGGVKVAIERRDPAVSAIYRENWGESPSVNLGTPGLPNEVEPDYTAPEIIEIVVVDDQNLIAIFSERIEQAAAEDISNFTLNAEPDAGEAAPPLPDISSLQRFAPDSVAITLNSPLTEFHGSWVLEAENQSDVFGNTGSSNIYFNYYVFFTAQRGDVVINEFMFIEPSGFSEYIELYNHTDSTFDLAGWTINDNTRNVRTIINNSYPLQAGQYVVLAPDSTIAPFFPEVPLLTIGNRFPSLNNGTDDIVIRNQDGALIDSLTYFSSWGGNGVALERRNPSIGTEFKENWGSSPSTNFGTPGLPNEIAVDATPPDIASLSVIGNNAVRLVFSERVVQAQAELLSNYELSADGFTGSIPNLVSAQYFVPDTVLLTFDADFPSQTTGTRYELKVTEQTDIFGNVAAALTKNFFIIEYGTAGQGEVAITEFMYLQADGYSEYIELYNNGDSTYNLRDWTYNDNSRLRRSITSANYSLNPGEYVIIAPDSTIAHTFPGTPIITMSTRFSALNNNTDDIVIRNQHGTLIDSLTYFSTWGGNNVALERRDVNVPAIYQENWGNSPSPFMGTPGKPNDIAADVTPPEILNAIILSADSIKIVFSERIDSLQAVNTANYSIPQHTIAKAEFHRTEVTLILSNALISGQEVELTIKNQDDIFGNRLVSETVELEYISFSPAGKYDIVVNEILYRRKDTTSPEFFELYNTTTRNFNLTDWTYSDAGTTVKLPAGTILRGHEYLVVTDRQDFAATLPNAVYISNFPTLNDNEDAVIIKNELGELIDSVYYFNHWGGNLPGVSLERLDPDAASNDISNWATSNAEGGHSAGLISSVYEPDTINPEIIFAKLMKDGRVTIAFSEFVELSQSEITINGQAVSVEEFDEDKANVAIVSGIDEMDATTLEITLKNVSDVKGNIAASTSVEIAHPLKKGSVVINEILYDPLANPDDNIPDQTEYIELYNREDYAISLEGFYLHDAPDEKGVVRSIFPASSAFSWIPAKSYVLVYAEDLTPVFAESRINEYFNLEEQNEQFAIRVHRSNLSIANTGDAIFIADSSGMVIDSVFYDQSWQNPNLYTAKGVALERINPHGPSDDRANWSSSTHITGGTPGYQNSIYQEPGSGPGKAGISFSPNPFSPDDDGFEDNLFINYKLDHSDYLLRIRIFDRYGRLVRELADGYPAGFEGSLIWDGLTDDRRKNRVGIYIVLFEAYNSAQGKRLTFKETVVLARKFN